VDASLIQADANKQRSIPGSEWQKTRDPETSSRALMDYLATLDDKAFGAASEVRPKFISPSDPAAPWTGATRGPAFFSCADNLIDLKFGITVGVVFDFKEYIALGAVIIDHLAGVQAMPAAAIADGRRQPVGRSAISMPERKRKT
jgi:hypothetical protein